MITKERLLEKINEEIKVYDEQLLERDKEDLVRYAYEIAETHEFYNFISRCFDPETDIFCIQELCSVVDDETKIIESLYEFEMNYDEPMWCNWDNINTVIEDFANERRK